ncbi:BTB/POZ domain-containing protein 3-like protein [Aphelenchoides avenae]|nr:BTB/POZ domain-containing protein 3-like protein [Aphelenchus avenae]
MGIKVGNQQAGEEFIYTGATKISNAEVFPFLYLAKKYLVGCLVKALMGHLEEGITAENVGQVIYRGQNFLDDAPTKFWESVESHGDALLSSKEFLHLHKATVAALLHRNLEVDETSVYSKAVAWAKAQCARNKVPANAATIRKELEGIIQLIRFPTMSADEFSCGPATEEVLTAEEKVELFKWFLSRTPQKLFPDTPRYSVTGYVCERFECKTLPYDDDDGVVQAVDLQTDRSIRVTGFGIYGQSSHCFGYGRQRNYTIRAKLSLDVAVLATKEITGSLKESEDILLVNFDKAVKLDPGKYYTASVAVSGLSTSYEEKSTLTVEDVAVVTEESSEDPVKIRIETARETDGPIVHKPVTINVKIINNCHLARFKCGCMCCQMNVLRGTFTISVLGILTGLFWVVLSSLVRDYMLLAAALVCIVLHVELLYAHIRRRVSLYLAYVYINSVIAVLLVFVLIFLLIAIVKMPEFWQNYVAESAATSMDMVSVVVSTSDVDLSFVARILTALMLLFAFFTEVFTVWFAWVIWQTVRCIRKKLQDQEGRNVAFTVV